MPHSQVIPREVGARGELREMTLPRTAGVQRNSCSVVPPKTRKCTSAIPRKWASPKLTRTRACLVSYAMHAEIHEYAEELRMVSGYYQGPAQAVLRVWLCYAHTFTRSTCCARAERRRAMERAVTS
ncbi:hypothetical protein ACU4GD_46100 [Cupriavidus basilensis]